MLRHGRLGGVRKGMERRALWGLVRQSRRVLLMHGVVGSGLFWIGEDFMKEVVL